MPPLKKPLASFLVILALLAVFPMLAQATTTNLTVQRGGETTYPLNLADEDRVLIQFKVVGESSDLNTLNFSLVYPNGTVRDFGETGDFGTAFICHAPGDYTLCFLNGDLTGKRLVTLDCEVDHYILGIPQMLFMTILIAVICVVGVAVFVMLSRKP